MSLARSLTRTVAVAALIAAVGIGTGYALNVDGVRDPEPRPAGLLGAPGTPTTTPRSAPATEAPRRAREPRPRTDRTPEPVEPQGGPPLMSPGESSAEIRGLQARLRQIQWFAGDVTGYYGDITTRAVSGFQAKREIAVTGYVDAATLDRLFAMTSEPSADELANRVAASASNAPGALDPRCTSGRVLCIDKSSNTLRWVVDSQVRTTVDVRFGSQYTPTREGTFSVQSKSRDHVSSLYDTPMPFAMFFSGGQAVHYSPDFAAVGYAGASHGCVNVRDYAAVAALFDQVLVGDRVVVYRS